MMGGINHIFIVGNLGRDPEIRYTKDNKPVANFSVAASESWKDKQGEWVERTEWFRVVAFGYTAEKVERTFAKGKQVLVEGKMQTRKWTDKDGNEQTTTEIVADRVMALGRKEEGGKPAGVGDSGHFEAPQMPAVQEEEDDLPF